MITFSVHDRNSKLYFKIKEEQSLSTTENDEQKPETQQISKMPETKSPARAKALPEKKRSYA